MDNLEMLEVKMVQDIDEYVKSMDSFETALNARNTDWHNRNVHAKKNSENRKKMLNLIISLIIAGAAVLFSWQILV